jgi:hypothetical protein
MTTVHIAPVRDELPGMISLHHDFETAPQDAEVSLSQAYADDPTSNDADVITFHPDRIPALIHELELILVRWQAQAGVGA